MSVSRGKPVDFEARERARSDLGSSFCLEAGAGTGKTTILVERFLSIVRSGRAECAAIAAITFTEKAAAEMKDRLMLRIEDVLVGGDASPEEMDRLERARDELERAQISTIHSFASTMLREYPLEAGVDPGFAQMDEIDSYLFRERCFDDYLAGAGGGNEQVLRRLLPLGRPSDCVGLLRDVAFRYYEGRAAGALGGLFETREPGRGGGPVPPPDPQAHRDYLVSSADRLMEMAREGCVKPEDKGMLEISAFHDEAGLLAGLSGDRLAARLLALSTPASKGNRANWSPAQSCADQKCLCSEISDAHGKFVSSWMDAVRDDLTAWCAGFVEFADGRKVRSGVLDFNDLLIKARGLLDDEAALEALRSRYSFILVDEFQDTDPLQAEIIMLLASRGERSIEPVPGKLFVVGDPKQSIYRFRGADVEIYEHVREMLAEGGSSLKITQNFRSVPGITGWVNRAFSELIARPSDGRYMPDYEPLQAMRDEEGPAVFVLDLETGATKSDEFRREEGDAVARFIRDLVDSGREILDQATKERRPVRYGDIALIYRSTTGIHHYEDPLREADIPYLVEGGKLYFTRQEVRDIANAAWVIEDPGDSAALLAALRSPIFGFSDEEIFLLTGAGGKLDYLDPSVPDGDGMDDFGAAFSLLARLHRGRNAAGPANTLKSLLARTGYLSLSKIRVHGEQRVLNLRKVLQTARLFEERMHSFRSFARWMKDQGEAGSAEGESPAIDEGENAVRMITIHKAKGLQFPVVILVNLVQRFRQPDKIIFRQGMAPAINFKGSRTSDYAEAAEREKRMDMAETIRLLYVASTRAGDMLVIPRSPEGPGHYGIISRFIEDAGSGDAPGDVVPVSLSSLPELVRGGGPFPVMPKITTDGVAGCSEIRAGWAAQRRELLGASPPGPVAVYPSSIAGHGPEDADILEKEEGGRGVEGVDQAMLFGGAFHRMMELALGGGVLPDPAVPARTAAEEAGRPDISDELAALGAKALGSSLIKAAAKAERMLVEVPFKVPLPRSEDLPAGGSLDGRIDLMFESGGVWTVVDFKTDDIRAEETSTRIDAYRPQGAAYAYALESLGIGPVGRVVFYFVRPDADISIDVDPEFIAEGKRLVKSAALRPASRS